MTVVDMAEAAMERAHRMAPCREASEWAEHSGYDPTIFLSGQPFRLSEAEPETFRRFKDLMGCMPDYEGMSMADAVDWVAFDASEKADMVCVFHEVLEMAPLQSPVVMPGLNNGRDMVICSSQREES